MPKPLDPEKVASLSARVARLEELKGTLAWQELREIVHERKERYFRSWTARLMAGAMISQREVDRTAGFFKGMETLLDYPELTETQLRRALERAEREERERSE